MFQKKKKEEDLIGKLPGATRVTRKGVLTNSFRRDSVNPLTANFEAQ